MITIIMPCLNAAGSLQKSLPPLVDGVLAGLVSKLIVVDGGSTDNTVKIADAAGAAIIETKAGRGHQLKLGAGAATTDFLLFLHADTVLAPDWVEAAGQFCADRGPMAQAAAYFKFALDDKGAAAKAMSQMVHLRNGLFGLPYGDQGLLISQLFYQQLGGYQPLPLMEDVALARKIGKKRLNRLGSTATTSAARYQKNGYLKQSTSNLWRLTRYFMGTAPEKLAAGYHQS